MSDDKIIGARNVVKVEVSPFDDEAQTFSFFSHDGTIDKDIPVDDEILARMAGETIKYFYYRKTDDGNIELLNEAGEQEW